MNIAFNYCIVIAKRCHNLHFERIYPVVKRCVGKKVGLQTKTRKWSSPSMIQLGRRSVYNSRRLTLRVLVKKEFDLNPATKKQKLEGFFELDMWVVEERMGLRKYRIANGNV